MKVVNRGYKFKSELTTTQEGNQRLRDGALDRQATRTRLVVLLLVLGLGRGLLLRCLCCALAGLSDWSPTTNGLLLVVGLRTRGAIMQSCHVLLGEDGPEGLALLVGERELLLRRLSAAVGTSEGTGTPRRTTTDLGEVSKSTEDSLVAEGNEDHAVVNEGRHGADDGGLLTTAGGASGNEGTSVLAPEGTVLPLATSLVPEGLELSGPVAVSGGDTEEETVVLLESRGVCEHLVLGSHGLRSTLDLVDGDVTTSLSDTSGLLLDQLRDVAVRREKDDSDVGSHF